MAVAILQITTGGVLAVHMGQNQDYYTHLQGSHNRSSLPLCILPMG